MPVYRAPKSLLVSQTPLTGNVTISNNTEGTAHTLATSPTFTADGITTYFIEFFAPVVGTGAVNLSQVSVVLLEQASVLAGFWGQIQNPGTAAVYQAMRLGFFHLPAAGSRQYIAKAFAAGSNGVVAAGVGGSGAFSPAYLAIYRT